MVLTVSGAFTDEADAVSAVKVVPVGIVNEAGTVLTVFVSMSPVVRLTWLPLPDTTYNHCLILPSKSIIICYL